MLAVESKRSKPRFWDEGRNKVTLRTESKWVLILHLVARFGWKVLLIWLKILKRWIKALNYKERVQTSSSFTTKLQAFYSKFQNWRGKAMQGNVAMFEKSSSVVEKTEERDQSLKTYNRPPSIAWNWVSAIFLWAQGGSCIYTKSILYLSGCSQYSRLMTVPILWSSEWFFSTWYFSRNATFSDLVSCARIISITV